VTQNVVVGLLILTGAALCGWDVYRSLSTGIGQWAYLRRFDRRTSPEEYWFAVILGVITAVGGLLIGTFVL